MVRSLQRLGWLCVGAYALSSCTLLATPNPLPMSPESAATTTDEPAPTDAATVSDPPAVADTTAESQATATSQQNYFQEGVTRAQSAVAIGQSAQSSDDWTLAASRWQQAVLYMQQVPSSDNNYAIAQQKIQEYGQNLALAEQRAAGNMSAAPAPTNTNQPPGLVASIPVVDQWGGTPVVPVTLTGKNGTQRFTMLFDTGATGTLITQEMAQAIGVVVTGSAVVTVADGRQVEIPVGYVDTLQVGDLVVRDIWVGIGGDVGLLGQDVYGEYGLSIGGSQIDLYE
ncbi:MAG: TIGR02281 family clan AA aspartic protease [Leptolyngbyaceae cyanobacterium]